MNVYIFIEVQHGIYIYVKNCPVQLVTEYKSYLIFTEEPACFMLTYFLVLLFY